MESLKQLPNKIRDIIEKYADEFSEPDREKFIEVVRAEYILALTSEYERGYNAACDDVKAYLGEDAKAPAEA